MAETLGEHKDLGKMLHEEGLISKEQLEAAREQQRKTEKSIGRVLVDMGLITEQAKMTFVHKRFGYEIVDIRDMFVEPATLEKISRSYAEKYRCVPILIDKGKLVLAMEDPSNFMVLEEIRTQAGMDVEPVLAPVEEIDNIILQYPSMNQQQADAIKKRLRRPRWFRLLHPLAFWIVMLLPFLVFYLGVNNSATFGNRINSLGDPWDIALYLVLGWALWAILIWEIDGLIFGAPEKREGY